VFSAHFKVRSNDHRQIEIEKSAKYTDLFVCPVRRIFNMIHFLIVSHTYSLATHLSKKNHHEKSSVHVNVFHAYPYRMKLNGSKKTIIVTMVNKSQWPRGTCKLIAVSVDGSTSFSIRSVDHNDTVQQLVSPLKRLKTNTDASNEVKSTTTEPLKAINSPYYIVKVCD
jgi:hypothetical protein